MAGKNLDYVLLLDCYGELLTERQRSITEMYYCEDLSLSEIGESCGVTRQGARSVIKRTESLLDGYEARLGFAARLRGLKRCIGRIQSAAADMGDTPTGRAILDELSEAERLL